MAQGGAMAMNYGCTYLNPVEQTRVHGEERTCSVERLCPVPTTHAGGKHTSKERTNCSRGVHSNIPRQADMQT